MDWISGLLTLVLSCKSRDMAYDSHAACPSCKILLQSSNYDLRFVVFVWDSGRVPVFEVTEGAGLRDSRNLTCSIELAQASDSRFRLQVVRYRADVFTNFMFKSSTRFGHLKSRYLNK